MHMKLSEYLSSSRVEIGAELYSKDEALSRLIALQKQSGAIHNTRALQREVNAAERRGSSAVSGRIAIRDLMHSGAVRTSITAVTVKNGVDCGAPDKRPVRLLFMIAGKSGSKEHESVKEYLKRLVSDPSFTARLCAAQSKEEFLELIEEREGTFKSNIDGRSKPLPYNHSANRR